MPLCAVFVLQTKTAQNVGVAGTDVPIEDIKKLFLSHEVSVIWQFSLHTKSTLKFFGFTYANTCDVMRKLIQCLDQYYRSTDTNILCEK